MTYAQQQAMLERARKYIDAAPTQEERNSRKREFYAALYGTRQDLREFLQMIEDTEYKTS